MGTHKKELEEIRENKIKELGFLCYNLAVDGVFNEERINEKVIEIKEIFGKISYLRGDPKRTDFLDIYLSRLNDGAAELGCLCYNLLYINKKNGIEDLKKLCGDIYELNRVIFCGYEEPDDFGKNNEYNAQAEGRIIAAKPAFEGYAADVSKYDGKTETAEGKIDFSCSDESIIKRFSDFDEFEDEKNFNAKYPYGMEPIPKNAKVCICGYRNRPYANFCGKCGSKL